MVGAHCTDSPVASWVLTPQLSGPEVRGARAAERRGYLGLGRPP